MTETLCESCGKDAIARVASKWLCARCGGLQQTNASAGIGTTPDEASPGPTRSWRGITRAAVGSGLVAKVLIGAAALAAVGGAVVTDVPPPTFPPTSTPSTSTPADLPVKIVPSLPPSASETARDATPEKSIPPTTASSGPTSSEAAEQAAAVVEEARLWNACINDAVHAFAIGASASGSGFDPFDHCGERPKFSNAEAGTRSGGVGPPDVIGPAEGTGPPDNPGRPDDPGSQRRVPQNS